jgi:hypothetical protein
MSAFVRITDSSRTSRHVRFVPILLQKSAAFALKQRAERCGVSKWHPDIVAACERADAEQRRTAAK